MSMIAGDTPVFELGPDDPGRGVGLPLGVRLEQVAASRQQEAAVRLVGDQTDDPYSTARRFLESAELLNIDLALMWATIGPTEPGQSIRGGRSCGSGGPIRQVALVVPGSGRTAMVFVSGPARRRRGGPISVADLGSGIVATRERVAAIRAACQFIASGGGSGQSGPSRSCALAQSLLEARETDAIAAFRAAGFTQVGDLAYMRRTAPGPPATLTRPIDLPDGFRVRSLAAMRAEGVAVQDIDRDLRVALDRSYIDTADCPELCGLRSTEDVLCSHQTVGRYDPALWWLAYRGDEPEACLLFSVCPEQESVELVYLGLSPALRGRGLGAYLLHHGLRVLHGRAIPDEAPGFICPNSEPPAPRRCLIGPGGVTCAVDTRNEPAMTLYRRFGFQRFAVRVPMVLRLA